MPSWQNAQQYFALHVVDLQVRIFPISQWDRSRGVSLWLGRAQSKKKSEMTLRRFPPRQRKILPIPHGSFLHVRNPSVEFLADLRTLSFSISKTEYAHVAACTWSLLFASTFRDLTDETVPPAKCICSWSVVRRDCMSSWVVTPPVSKYWLSKLSISKLLQCNTCAGVMGALLAPNVLRVGQRPNERFAHVRGWPTGAHCIGENENQSTFHPANNVGDKVRRQLWLAQHRERICGHVGRFSMETFTTPPTKHIGRIGMEKRTICAECARRKAGANMKQWHPTLDVDNKPTSFHDQFRSHFETDGDKQFFPWRRFCSKSLGSIPTTKFPFSSLHAIAVFTLQCQPFPTQKSIKGSDAPRFANKSWISITKAVAVHSSKTQFYQTSKAIQDVGLQRPEN